jgi:hypothetical protein
LLQVSRVLKLPIPAKSSQLLGKEFVGEEGRGANLIDIGNGTVVVRFRSTAPLHVHLSTILCVPPRPARPPCGSPRGHLLVYTALQHIQEHRAWQHERLSEQTCCVPSSGWSLMCAATPL